MKYYTDGYTLGQNPSDEGGGYSVVDENGELIAHEVIRQSHFTNNEAEIRGIEHVLKICAAGDQISTDSMNALTWIHAGKSKARADLNEVLKFCQKELVAKKVNLMWEGRDFNLAGHFNEAFDTATLRVNSLPKEFYKEQKRQRKAEKKARKLQEQYKNHEQHVAQLFKNL